MSTEYKGSIRGVFDADFRYKTSFETDIRKTFERIRRAQAAAARQAAKPLPDNVESLPLRKEVK
jgi:hypothetical protein